MQGQPYVCFQNDLSHICWIHIHALCQDAISTYWNNTHSNLSNYSATLFLFPWAESPSRDFEGTLTTGFTLAERHGSGCFCTCSSSSDETQTSTVPLPCGDLRAAQQPDTEKFLRLMKTKQRPGESERQMVVPVAFIIWFKMSGEQPFRFHESPSKSCFLCDILL